MATIFPVALFWRTVKTPSPISDWMTGMTTPCASAPCSCEFPDLPGGQELEPEIRIDVFERIGADGRSGFQPSAREDGPQLDPQTRAVERCQPGRPVVFLGRFPLGREEHVA